MDFSSHYIFAITNIILEYHLLDMLSQYHHDLIGILLDLLYAYGNSFQMGRHILIIMILYAYIIVIYKGMSVSFIASTNTYILLAK